ncbi:histidine phosphatase family protein [Streptomyces venezuelae]|uniref:histidine phosphatase family protein n=1 Tax=Streptomyces venezuelae TaxID=54571 RepID=UPI003448495F
MTDRRPHLLLVRHAEAEHYSAACSDPGLTARGRRQSQLLADWLGKNTPDILFSSTLRRAADTARAVAERTGLPVGWDARLREVGTCRPDGRPLEGAGLGGVGLPPRERPLESVFPGAESWVEFRVRVGLAMDRVLAATAAAGGRAAVVCHGGVLDALLDNIVDADVCSPVEVAWANTAVTHLEHRPRETGSPWVLHSHNTRPHLKDEQLDAWTEAAR